MRLHTMMKRTKANKVVFASDGHPEQSIRRKFYPPYKLKRTTRDKTEEELKLDAIAYPQFNTVEDEVLPEMGFRNIFGFHGLEADDVIGKVCKTYRKAEIVIVTTDQDMYQLLTPLVCIMNPKNFNYYTAAMFKKEFGIEPKMWKRVKAIAGCSSDEVKGIYGVSDKTVLKYLKGELPKHYKAYQNIVSPEGKKIINRNKSLVILPHRKTPNITLKEDAVSKIKVQGVAKRYNFKGILQNVESWTNTFKGWHR